MQHDDNMNMDHDPTASASQQSDSYMDTAPDTTLVVDTAAERGSAAPRSPVRASVVPTAARALSPGRTTTTQTATGKTGSPSATTASVHQSAKMMDAQGYFQRVVKQELQVLLESGMEREVAVKKLLHRIVESTDEPEPSDVRRVMRQFQMNHDDAVRALIVKQEIGRLKRQGMDAFAAIGELTRKMQSIIVVPRDEEKIEELAEEKAEEGGATPLLRLKKRRNSQIHEHGETMQEHGDLVGAAAQSPSRGGDQKDSDVGQDAVATLQTSGGACERTDEKNATMDAAASGESSASKLAEAASSVAATEETGDDISTPGEEEENASTSHNLSPLSLCQRIGNVTISSSAASKKTKSRTPSLGEDGAASSGASTADSVRSHLDVVEAGLQSPQSRSSSSSSSFSSPSPFSRKRRGVFGPFAGIDGKDLTSHRQSSSSSSSEHPVPSTLPLFPSSKKQKLMVEVGDSFLSMVSRKCSKVPVIPSGSASPIASPPSPSSSNISSDTSTTNSKSHTHPHGSVVSSMNPHKRQREVAHPPGFGFPVLDDDLSVADHIIHHTKRHKS